MLDKRRNAAFVVFGAWFLGAAQYGVYVKLFSRWFPKAENFAAKSLREKWADKAGQKTVLKQLALDQLVWHPFFYLPCFYQTKVQIQGKSAVEAFDVYRRNFKTDIPQLWMAASPVYLFTFTFCPMWARVPFVGFYSLMWTMWISFRRGSLLAVD